MSKFIAAAIQMASTDNIEENLRQAGMFLDEAAARGAKLAALPEYLHYVARRSREAAEEIPGGRTFQFFSEKAKQLDMWILAGTIFEKKDGALPYNTSMLIAPDGSLAAKYRKTHLCDLVLPGGHPRGHGAGGCRPGPFHGGRRGRRREKCHPGRHVHHLRYGGRRRSRLGGAGPLETAGAVGANWGR